MKARIFTVPTAATNRVLVQMIDINTRKVFNAFVDPDDELLETFQETYDFEYVNEQGNLLESAKVDKWAYEHGMFPETRLRNF